MSLSDQHTFPPLQSSPAQNDMFLFHNRERISSISNRTIRAKLRVLTESLRLSKVSALLVQASKSGGVAMLKQNFKTT